MLLKFLGPAGGYTSDAVECLNDATWFANNSNDGVDVKISNNSRGGDGFSQYLKDAIESSGILFVAAASNEGTDNGTSPLCPSGYGTNYKTTPISDAPPNVIAVAATDSNDELASFSN